MTPYLSIVAVGRNDGYGGDFIGRMENFLQSVAALSARHRLPTELVIVEWNPPSDRPRLAQAVSWSTAPTLAVRLFEVMPQLHARFPNADRIPVHEYIAKNVGVRRARGDFVLATNPDLLFNASLQRFVARRNLRRGCFYRVDRYDVDSPLPDGPLAKQLRFAKRNFSRVNVHGDTIRVDAAGSSLKRSARGVARLAHAHFDQHPLDDADPIRRLHTNASGDFMLMHRDDWHGLRGYPELTTAGHIDSYLCVIAASSGMEERALPHRYRIYHQEHARALDWSRIESSTRPVTEYEQYARDAREMLAQGTPKLFNRHDWGLGDEDLPESTIASGRP